MVKSMTGYGRKKAENDQREVTVEIKSVNHRYLDLNIKVPRIYSFLEEAVKMRELTRKYHVPLMINDNIEIASACDADGVHVGQSDVEAGKARRLIGPDKILGVTAKTVEQAVLAEKNGADYLGVGAVFGSKTKKDAVPMTIERLGEIAGAVSIPIVAIGGISGDNILKLRGSGIAGAAVVSGIFASGDIRQASLDLLEKVKIVTGICEG